MSTIAQPDPTVTEATPSAPTDQVTAARPWPRRTVLAGSGAVLLACAACGSGSSAGSAAPTSSSSSAASSSAGSAAGAAGTIIASVSDIPSGSGLIATAPSGKVVLAEADGQVVAHTAVCTHQGGIIDGAGVCPLHGSKFNVTTGAVLDGPATEPLAAVTVRVTGGKVYSA